MAMSHESCSHPRTPAGRAACRKAGGPSGTTPAPVVELTTKGMRKQNVRIEVIPKSSRKRAIKKEHDLVDVPHVFSPTIRHAMKVGWIVNTGTPYHAAERVVHIVSEAGTGTLVWKCNNPHGVTRVEFRPMDTSVSSVVPSVNELLRKLEG